MYRTVYKEVHRIIDEGGDTENSAEFLADFERSRLTLTTYP